MPGIVADNDVEGQFNEIVRRLESVVWKGVWLKLGFTAETFASLGLKNTTPDRQVWQACQAREWVLITGNRNSKGPDSLEATIRECSTSSSLPVLTIGNLDTFAHSSDYVGQAVEKLLEYLMDLDRFRGAGRLFIP